LLGPHELVDELDDAPFIVQADMSFSAFFAPH
jgi:hypothetical protein